MAAERFRTATCDHGEHLLMLFVDPPSTAVDETLSCVANDVSHLQRRPAYTLRIAVTHHWLFVDFSAFAAGEVNRNISEGELMPG